MKIAYSPFLALSADHLPWVGLGVGVVMVLIGWQILFAGTGKVRAPAGEESAEQWIVNEVLRRNQGRTAFLLSILRVLFGLSVITAGVCSMIYGVMLE